MSSTDRTLERQARAARAAEPPRSTSEKGDQCHRCPYSLMIHVAADGAWIGCPPDEFEAVLRWGVR